MKKVKVFDINWDTEDDTLEVDNEELNLPSEVEMKVPEGFKFVELDDYICEKLSDDYGFCVNSFAVHEEV